MSQETNSTLQRSLNAMDQIRTRILAGGWLIVAVTMAAYGYFYYALRTSDDLERIISAGLTAVTCLIAWVSFSIILVIVKMTKRILLAIELSAK